MKRFLLLLLLLSAPHAFAVNDYLAHTSGSIGDTDVILFETTGGTIYKTSAGAIKIYCAYTLPVATSSVLGGVKQGSGVSIAGDGTISVAGYTLPVATNSVLGGVKQGSGVSIAGDGTISVAGYTLPVATSSVLGGVKQGSGVSIAGDGTISATVYSLPTATTSVLGGVKPDGTTIANISGAISIGTFSKSHVSDLPTFPDSTIVGIDDSQTLTNKSIDASEINSGTLVVSQGGTGVTSFTPYAPLFGGTTGTDVVQSGTVGTTGQVLMSNGTGALPTFQDLPAPTPMGYQVISSSTTAVSGEKYWPIASGITITLPAPPTEGMTVRVTDFAGSNPYSTASGLAGFATNPVTVGSIYGIININGYAGSTVSLSNDYEDAVFTFHNGSGAASGWFMSTVASRAAALYVARHAAGTPTVAGSTGAGTSPTLSIASGGSDVSGVVNITTGSSPSTSATVATVTYNTAYATAPNAVLLTPANAAASALTGAGKVFVSASNTGTFVITSGSTALAAATAYKFYYEVPQQ